MRPLPAAREAEKWNLYSRWLCTQGKIENQGFSNQEGKQKYILGNLQSLPQSPSFMGEETKVQRGEIVFLN